MTPKLDSRSSPAFDPLGKTREQLFQALGTGDQGLSQVDVPARQQRYGMNQISFHRAHSPWWMLLQEFTALFPL
ncbi:MAG TPA: cation-transporting P-type ATPase, partial [Gammaproteobacteria bacterium]|nr:cation-transporting P-type ATPase [Gammaproteobacteria bacterium]